MQIGKVVINKKAALAPMAGVTDQAFREICADFGAAYVVSEMVSAKGMHYTREKSSQLMESSLKGCPAAVQLFGDDPTFMARAAEMALAFAPDVIDINMGCPAPKVNASGGGASLMKKPALCAQIVKAVASAVNVPVTIKIRKGWDETSINGVEVAKRCEEAGAAAITIHGRTRAQMYAPTADWDYIAQVKRAVCVPVIGNGDIFAPEDAAAMYEQTGCDLVMIGRGACGNPWIFARVQALLSEGRLPPEPDVTERMRVMCRHIALLCGYKGERTAMREARKHAAWYMRGLKGAASFRREAVALETLEQLHRLAARVVEEAEKA